MGYRRSYFGVQLQRRAPRPLNRLPLSARRRLIRPVRRRLTQSVRLHLSKPAPRRRVPPSQPAPLLAPGRLTMLEQGRSQLLRLAAVGQSQLAQLAVVGQSLQLHPAAVGLSQLLQATVVVQSQLALGVGQSQQAPQAAVVAARGLAAAQGQPAPVALVTLERHILAREEVQSRLAAVRRADHPAQNHQQVRAFTPCPLQSGGIARAQQISRLVSRLVFLVSMVDLRAGAPDVSFGLPSLAQSTIAELSKVVVQGALDLAAVLQGLPGPAVHPGLQPAPRPAVPPESRQANP